MRRTRIFILIFFSAGLMSFAQPSFSRVFSGAFVNDGGISAGACWGDYDNDGYLDLFVANWNNQDNFLYRNNGDGTFTRITEGRIVNDGGFSSGPCWGDYDNDGFLDLFVANQRNQHNFLYHNNGDGTFTKISSGDIVTDYGNSYTGAWGDYNNDGYLDLFVANAGQNCFLYKNNQDGSFSRIKNIAVVQDVGRFWNASWGDYNNDGYIDLFIADSSARGNYLYQNNGDGTFSKITEGPINSDRGYSMSGSWGDMDNDGDLDLFVANAGTSLEGQNDFLYNNNGDGTFTKIEDSPIVKGGGYSHGGVWGDFDKDGDLDLFIGIWGLCDKLYVNKGAGVFEAVTDGPIVTQPGFVSCSPASADFDNDGDLDLYHANWENQNNVMFRNNTTGNNWIKIRCEGTTSNSNAIGAKVIVEANMGNGQVTQMREIRTNNGCRSQSGADAFFGLADAKLVDRITIKWPSGKVEKIENCKSNQTITVCEGKGITHKMPPIPTPKQSAVGVLFQVFQKKGVIALLKEYDHLLKNKHETYALDDQTLIALGNYILTTLGKVKEAIQILETNIHNYPKSAQSHALMGRALAKIGQKEQAIEYFKEAIDLIAEETVLDDQTREDLVNGIEFELKNLKNKE